MRNSNNYTSKFNVYIYIYIKEIINKHILLFNGVMYNIYEKNTNPPCFRPTFATTITNTATTLLPHAGRNNNNNNYLHAPAAISL